MASSHSVCIAQMSTEFHVSTDRRFAILAFIALYSRYPYDDCAVLNSPASAHPFRDIHEF